MGKFYRKTWYSMRALQEFAQRVSFIANLETGGKLSPEESYQQIQALWKQL